MASFDQRNRPLQIETPLGPNAVLVQALQGTEAISQLYEFRLQWIAPNSLPPIDFQKLLGQAVRVTARTAGTSPRYFHGIVMQLSQGDRDPEITHWQAIIRPRWWIHTLRHNSRIFQQMTVIDILQELLTDVGKVEYQITGTYPKRDFTCQYQETDFAFASRLLEEEGIFYWFRHTDTEAVLVISDSLSTTPAVESPRVLRYDQEKKGGNEPRVWNWRKTQQVVATQFTLWDSCFERFGQNFESVARVSNKTTAGTVTHQPKVDAIGEVLDYQHDGDYAKRFDGVSPNGADQSVQLQQIANDGERVAGLRAEESAVRSLRITAESNCPNLMPGCSFELVGHFDADGKYLIRRVEHDLQMGGTFTANVGPRDIVWTNRLELGPVDLVPRPARVTPRPKVGGCLTATVVGPRGEEIFVDKYGRVKVQFHWDRLGKHDANSSCWIRVAQLWAGKTWGAFFWPRIGMEVVVVFEDGDIDRPLIVGCVYNSTNLPPTDLPKEATVGGIKSCIFNGNPAINFNALYFHDTPGVEYIQLHSETNEIQNAEANKFHYVPGLSFRIEGSL